MPATPTEIGKQQKNLKLKPSMVSMPTYTALGHMPVPNAWEQLKIPIPYCTQWAAEHIHLLVLHRMTFHAMPKSQFQSNQMVNVDFWLVVLTILKNISQWEGLSHISWKTKNVPNHQPDLNMHNPPIFVARTPQQWNPNNHPIHIPVIPTMEPPHCGTRCKRQKRGLPPRCFRVSHMLFCTGPLEETAWDGDVIFLHESSKV